MEKEVKDLFEYMKQEKTKLQEFEKECFELKSEKGKFIDENSAFYKQVEQAYNNKYKEYDSYRKQVKEGIKAKKTKALEVYAKKMEKIDKIDARLNEKYDKIKSTREAMEGKKAKLKWLENTLPTEGKNNEDNRMKLETLKEDIENMEIEIKSLGEEAIANQEILTKLVPKNKKPSEFYKELQEESKFIKCVDFMNLDETEKIFEAKRVEPKVDPTVKSGPNTNSTVKSGSNTNPAVKSGPNTNTAVKSGPNTNPAVKSGPNTNTAVKSGPNTNPAVKSGPNTNSTVKSGSNTNPVVNTDSNINSTTEPEDHKYAVIINAENGAASFIEERDGMSIRGQFKLDDIFKHPKKIRKEVLEYMNDVIKETGLKLKFKDLKKLNPAILKVLMEAEQPQLLYNYITAIKNKSDLPFMYDADLKNPENISKKTLYRLNNQLIRDNKDLSTDFNVVKNLRLKNALSKLPKFNGIKALPGKVKQSFKNGKETIDTAKDLKEKGKSTIENIADNIETKYGRIDGNEVKQKTNSDTNVRLKDPGNLSDKLKREYPPIQPKIGLTSLANQKIQQQIRKNDELEK